MNWKWGICWCWECFYFESSRLRLISGGHRGDYDLGSLLKKRQYYKREAGPVFFVWGLKSDQKWGVFRGGECSAVDEDWSQQSPVENIIHTWDHILCSVVIAIYCKYIILWKYWIFFIYFSVRCHPGFLICQQTCRTPSSNILHQSGELQSVISDGVMQRYISTCNNLYTT
jgi:hypothetical protein